MTTHENSATRSERIVREPERRAMTGVPTATWYRYQAEGKAPKPVPCGERSVGWLESELLEWVERRKAERDTGGTWLRLGAGVAQP
jgi:prophage regulatory protein